MMICAGLALGLGSCLRPTPDPELISVCQPPAVREAERRGGGSSARAGGRTRNVVLVMVDGVRWQEIFGGVDGRLARGAGVPGCSADARALLPHSYRHLVDGGVALGAPGRGLMLATGRSPVSLPGYLELLGGRPSASCLDNDCPRVTAPTALDELRRRAGLRRDEVALFTSWPSIERAATAEPTSLIAAVGQRSGATRGELGRWPDAAGLLLAGEREASWPGDPGYRPDRHTAALALTYLRLARPRLLVVGLGDTDEHAHQGRYDRYLAALREADRFVGALHEALASLGAYGEETSVLLTTDHGRADDFVSHGADAPESARVFLLAGGGAIPARGLVTTRRTLRLADVVPTIAALLELDWPPPADRLAGRVVAEALPPRRLARASR